MSGNSYPEEAMRCDVDIIYIGEATPEEEVILRKQLSEHGQE